MKVSVSLDRSPSSSSTISDILFYFADMYTIFGKIVQCWLRMARNDPKWSKRPQIVPRYIPSEKVGQNIDPLRNSFFVTKYQHWTGTSVLEPFLGPPDPWGGLGGHGGVLGGLPTPKLPFSLRDQF